MRHSKFAEQVSGEVPEWVFLVVLAVEVVILFLCLREIRAIVHRNGFYGSLSYEIYRFRNLGMYTTTSTSLGRGLEWLYQFNMASAYIWIYILAYRLAYKKKISLLLICDIGVSLLTGMSRGGRQSSIQILVAGVIYYFVFVFSQRKKAGIPWKVMIRVIAMVAIMAVMFQSVGTMLGRVVKADFLQYIAVYLCGSIRNLNEWLKVSHPLPDVFGKMTFVRLYPYLGRKLGKPEWIYVLDLPYLSANGRNSGNIYTTFYAFIYDFGYPGAVVLPFIMGVISQIIYKVAQKAELKSERDISFAVILYGYVAYTLAFSFFSNKFYEGLVQQGVIKYFIIWFIMIVVLKHIKLAPYPLSHVRANRKAKA